MATESELFAALRNADAAGDSAAARRFAEMIQESRAASQRGIQSTVGKSSTRVDWTSRLPITYTKDGKDQTVPPGDLASKLESEGWTRKYPGGVTGALRSAGAALGDMVPFSGGMPEMAGGVEGTVNWLKGKGEWAPEVVKATNEYKDLYAGTRRENPGLWTGTNLATQAAALPAALRATTMGRLGGPLAKTGSLLKAAGKTTAEAGLAGGVQASNQAPPGQRLEAGVKGALTSAAVAAPMALVSSPFLRDPSHVKVDEANTAASMVPAHAPELSWRNPGSLLNPESQRRYAASERIRSLESAPKMVEELASNFKNPVTGQPDLVAAGRHLNDATIPNWAAPSFGVRREMLGSEWLGNKAQSIRERYPWTQKILGTGAVPLLSGEDAAGAANVFGAVRNKAGPAIAQMEENKGLVNMGEFFDRARSGPLARLKTRLTEGDAPVRDYEASLTKAETRYPTSVPGSVEPVSTKLDWPASPNLEIPFPTARVVAGPEATVIHPKAEPLGYSRSVDRAPYGVPTKGQRPLPDRVRPGTNRPAPDSGWGPLYPYNDPAPIPVSQSLGFQGSMLPGQKIPELPKPVPQWTDINFKAPRSNLGSVADLADLTTEFRQAAKDRSASPGRSVSPSEATLGSAYAETSNIGARMKDEEMAKVLSPEQFSRYKDTKDLYHAVSLGNDATNEFRSAARRPEGLTQVIYGAAGAGLGGQFGLGGAIAGRQAGRELATQMQSGTGARAARATRFAEGIEGKGIDPFWQAAGAAARGVQSAPGRTVLATSAKTGSGMPDLLPSQSVVLVDKATREERAVSPDEAESLVASGKYETKDNAFVRTASRLAAGAKNAASSLTR